MEPLKIRDLFDPSCCSKIPNGLEEPESVKKIDRTELGIPANASVLCLIGRAVPDKGWREGIEIVKQARAQCGKDIHLLLVGDGEVYDKLRREGG